MIINDIYQDSRLKYPLTEEEYKLVSKVWEFLDIFKKRFIFISDYRKYMIRQIRKKYKIEDFYKYEMILNKMFWNLRWLLTPLWMDEDITEEEYDKQIENNYLKSKKIPTPLLLCKFIKYRDESDLKTKIKKANLGEGDMGGMGSFYRSFINKLMIVDKEKKELILKPMEGSPDIFSKNYFNLLTSHILFSKSLYEQIMKDPFLIRRKEVPLSEFYYQYDYAFPNLNYCKYLIGTDKDRIERIQKMYYYKGEPKAKNWFKLIY